MNDTTKKTDGVRRSAILSDCRLYRYRLDRLWDTTLPLAYWIMLNPSTADATTDDPTIRRCVAFARMWGCGGIAVANLFALRASDPVMLLRSREPIGPLNDATLHLMAQQATSDNAIVIAAWGATVGATNGTRKDTPFLLERSLVVRKILGERRVRLQCLGLTARKHPRHPLYVRQDTSLIEYPLVENQ